MGRMEIEANLEKIMQARHPDPFKVLGRHTENSHVVVRAYLPTAGEVSLMEGNRPPRRPQARIFLSGKARSTACLSAIA